MATTADFIPFYDYSKLETGLQDYFVGTGQFAAPPDDTETNRENWTPAAGIVPFFTALQSAVFQKNRPAVALDINNIAPVSFQAQGKVDSNGQIRATLYRATVNLTIITESVYATHAALRAKVAAYAMEICPYIPTGINSTVGVNQYLTHHLFTKLEDGGQSTAITPEDGAYMSSLTYNTTFAWRRDMLPS